jgi:hypothetical protein
VINLTQLAIVRRTTLRFFANRAPRVHGWFYHWMDASTARENGTASLIDRHGVAAGRGTDSAAIL